MGTGYLKIELRTGEDSLPVADADILVKDKDGNTIYNLKTDESGNTEAVELYAPDKEHTLNPNDAGPYYYTYDVEIRHGDNYITEVINDVQIFDGETTVLPINMMPNPLRTGNYINSHYIPANDLHSSAPRQQVGNIEENQSAVAPVVLKDVVIPEYITVHLGRPDDYARNVRVKFTDYIKNVLSSEIYPTWPTDAIIANAYAVITFALNRIYTEWYRSKGYDFDITNSTSVDQAYHENGNIFQNISDIVDDIFNQYVRREGRKEPFFTQFCNGTTSTCNGLSQWGTVTLANNGMIPIDILQSYYPKDIQIIETNNIANIAESYPGTALKEGSQGEDVQTMQKFLNRIRANYPAIPVIQNPDGVFGPDTTAAVKAFQKIFNYTQDGIIGKNTWYKISSIYIGITKLAELGSEGQRIGIGEAPPTSVLREGAKGEDVVELQFILNFISNFYPSIPLVIEDGTYRNTTTEAVKAFQRTFGLTSDGIVGSATWNMLYDVYKKIESDIQIPGVPTPTPPAPPVLPTPPTTPPAENLPSYPRNSAKS